MKAVILAGGRGTRLWPASTDNYPKQFHSLVSDKTLLQETYDRLNFLNPEDIFIATNESYIPLIIEQLPNIKKENIISEPAMRDTATCIGYAASYIAKKYEEEEVMSIIYADHLIQDNEEFEQKLKIAAQIAKEEKKITIIEVKAKFPNTNLGYVKIGNLDKTIGEVQVFNFAGFREKPDLETAKKFINSFSYLWNTGYFVWRIDTILAEFKKHLPHTYENLMEISSSIGTKNEKEITLNKYSECEKISIDYAIMEKLEHEKVKIIPADLGWSDIGTWESLHKELPADKENNVFKGDITSVNTKNSLIYNYLKNQKIAILDLDGITVVNTKNALLICPLSSSHRVKEVIKALQEEGNNQII